MSVKQNFIKRLCLLYRIVAGVKRVASLFTTWGPYNITATEYACPPYSRRISIITYVSVARVAAHLRLTLGFSTRNVRVSHRIHSEGDANCRLCPTIISSYLSVRLMYSSLFVRYTQKMLTV